MNRINSTKLSATLVVLVMLLNPIVGWAGAMMQANMAPVEMTDHTPTSMSSTTESNASGMSEHCHEQSAPSAPAGEHASECCDEPCTCGTGGCHSTLAFNSVISASHDTQSSYVFSAANRYLNPTLISLNPPPII